MDASIKEAFETLSREQQETVADFILFLSEKQDKQERKEKKPFPFDVFAGGLTYISDDFDKTPDCFEEYL